MRKRILPALWALSLILLSCRSVPVANLGTSGEAELAASLSAHERADFDAALSHAQKAVALAPKMIEAHLLLARIADDMCVPNAQPGPNMPLCRLAEQEYKTVLDLNARHLDALKNLAYLEYQFARLDESEGYYRRGLAISAIDPELACGLAAIGFRRVWPDIVKAKVRLNLKSDAPMIQLPSCAAMRERHQARVDEGIALLLRALEVKSNDLDLIGHLSTLYQLRAEIQCGNRPAYQADRNTARMWNLSGERMRNQDVPADFLQKCPPAPPPPPPDNE